MGSRYQLRRYIYLLIYIVYELQIKQWYISKLMVRYEGEKIMCTYHYALFTILRDILHTHPENLFLDYFPYINEYNEAIFDNRQHNSTYYLSTSQQPFINKIISSDGMIAKTGNFILYVYGSIAIE